MIMFFTNLEINITCEEKLRERIAQEYLITRAYMLGSCYFFLKEYKIYGMDFIIIKTMMLMEVLFHACVSVDDLVILMLVF